MKRRREGIAAALLFALAAAVRLVYVWSVRDDPSVRYPIADSLAYHEAALRILGDDWLGDRIFYQDPLYPYFLAGLYAVFEPGGFGVLCAQALLDAGSVVLVFEIARRLFGTPCGVLAGLIAAFYKVFFYYDALLLKVPLTLFLACLSLLLLLRAAETRTPRSWLLCGAGLGLATLTRGNYLLVVPALVLWIARFGGPRRLAAIAMLGVGVALVILPVTLRNRVVGDDWVLITSQAGQNFYIGNHRENRSGVYKAPPFVRANPRHEQDDFRREAERRTGETRKPSALSRYWFARAFEEIAAAPVPAARHGLRKLLVFLNDYEVPDNQSYEFFRHNVSALLRLPLPTFGLLVPFALAGMFLARRDPRAGLLTLFFATYALSIALFYNMSRYRIPVVPVAIVFASSALLQGFSWLRAGDWRRAGLLAGSAVSCLPLSQRSLMTEDFAFYRSNLGNAYRRHAGALVADGRRAEALALYDRAEREFRLGMERAPGDRRLERALRDLQIERARELEDAGQLEAALEEARKLTRAFPEAAGAYLVQARLLVALGRPEEAVDALQSALVVDPTSAAARRELRRLRQPGGRERAE